MKHEGWTGRQAGRLPMHRYCRRYHIIWCPYSLSKTVTVSFTPTHTPLFRAHLSRSVEALSMAYLGPCRYGWLNSFMHVINATFPHPGVGD